MRINRKVKELLRRRCESPWSREACHQCRGLKEATRTLSSLPMTICVDPPETGSEVADQAFHVEWHPLVPRDCQALFQPTLMGTFASN